MLNKQKEKVKPKFKNSSGDSPNYEKWNLKRRNTNFIVDQVLKLKYLANISFLKHSFAERLLKWREAMKQCAWLLMFEKQLLATGEQCYKFAFSFFCRNRHCFMCAWRKQLRLIARFLDEVIPQVEENFPKGRWLMLTLTVPNVHVSQLRDELKRMSKAWQRLIQRKELRVIKGWVRSTEITFEKKRGGYTHPHYHALLLVPGYYFDGLYYIKHARWVELWQDAMRLDIAPSIRIKPVKTNVDGALLEVVKAFSYSVKPEDLEADPELALHYFEQVDKMRFFASGGVLKEYLKPIMDAENAELDTFSEEEEQEVVSYENQAASWNEKDNEYQRDAKHDGYKKGQINQAKIDRNQYHLAMESLKDRKKKK